MDIRLLRLTGPFGEVVGRAYNDHSKNFLSPLMHINANSDQGVVTYEPRACESWRKPSKSHCLASCLRALGSLWCPDLRRSRRSVNNGGRNGRSPWIDASGSVTATMILKKSFYPFKKTYYKET